MTDLKDYLETVRNDLKEGLAQDLKLTSSVHLELSTVTELKTGGGIDIKIIEGGKQIASQNIQKISFDVALKSKTDELEEIARTKKVEAEIEKSEASIHMSKGIKNQRI